MNLQKKLKEKYYTKMPYQSIADKYGTTYNYVVAIAVGARKALRGKALKIKKELEQIVKDSEAREMKNTLDNYYTDDVRLAETEQEECELLCKQESVKEININCNACECSFSTVVESDYKFNYEDFTCPHCGGYDDLFMDTSVH